MTAPPDPWEPRTPRRRAALDRRTIARAATDLADASDLASLSMARVAGALGASTMALYRHVDSKDELVALMVELVLPAPTLPDGPHLTWRDRIEAWYRAQSAAVAAHPWLTALPAHALRATPASAAAWEEAGIRALDGTDLPQDVRGGIVRLLRQQALAAPTPGSDELALTVLLDGIEAQVRRHAAARRRLGQARLD